MFNAVAKALQLEPKPDYDKAPSLGSNPATILLDPSRTYADFDMPKLTDFENTVQAAVEYYKEFGVDREVTHLKLAKT
jgi:UDP-glucose 4-epimerase